jgi:putative ABC transport system permease protein
MGQITPDWHTEIRSRIAPLGLPAARENELVEELAAHLAACYDELRARGLSDQAARNEVSAGQLPESVLSEALAEVETSAPAEPVLGAGPGRPLLAGVADDVRYGWRALQKSPAHSVLALLTLALGIGVTTAIFSAVNAILLRPLPFREAHRLVTFWGTAPDKGLPVVNYPDAFYAAYRQRLRTVDPMAMYYQSGFTLTGRGAAERVEGAVVTVDFFRTLGVAPHVGRGFLETEQARGNNLVTVISHHFWQNRLGADPAVLGQSLRLNDIPTRVVGVMPPGFRFPDHTDLWIPIGIDPASLDCWCYDAIGRLGPGRTAADLAREIDAINADFWAEREGRPRPPPLPPGEASRSTIVKPLADALAGELRTPLLVLLGAEVLVLLIACANLANLQLARAVARRREIAVRTALGASPLRVARQFLAESLVLSLGGAALGVLCAVPALRVLDHMATERLPFIDGIQLDPVVLGFAALLGVFTGLLFGLAPARRAASFNLSAHFKEGARSTGSASLRRMNDAFVVSQLALSVVLLVGAGLLLRSLAQLMDVNPGFEPRNVLVGRIAVPWTSYQDMAQVRRLASGVTDRVRVLPGVVTVGLTSTAPFGANNNQQEFIVQGQEPHASEPVPVASIRRVSTGYFEAVGTPIVEGRAFMPFDRATSQQVAIIDESLARRYWPGASALGRRISTGTGRGAPVWRTVVGVVSSIRHGRLDRDPDHYVYYPLEQSAAWTLDLVVRTSVPPLSLLPALRGEIQAAHPDLPLYDVHTLEQAIDRSVSTRRFTGILLSAFAGFAMLLASIGLFGVMARSVAARAREFGVRLALGARPGQMEALVLVRGARLVLIGAVLGAAGAAAITRVLRGLLFEVDPLDPATFAATLLLLSAVTLAACWIPARRATRVDPLTALRAE